jgi:hypothetical protein
LILGGILAIAGLLVSANAVYFGCSAPESISLPAAK